VPWSVLLTCVRCGDARIRGKNGRPHLNLQHFRQREIGSESIIDTTLPVLGAGYDYTFSYDPMGRFEKISPTVARLHSNIIMTRRRTRPNATIT
jgi:hypothetical protein